MSKKIVILGAGYAGIEAALTLHKKKKKTDQFEIVIIDKNPYHTLLTELHEVAGNRISEDGIIVPLKDIFKYTSVKVIEDQISNIDFDKKILFSETEKYTYDYLVIAAGSHPNFYDIPGLEEYCFPLWSYKDALRIREHIKECFHKASLEKDPAKRKSLLTFVVGGGGFTGVEMIGELGLWVRSLCRDYSIPRNDVRLVLVEALPDILNNLKPEGIKKSKNYLTRKLKVEILLNKAITKLTPSQVELKDGTTIPTSTLIWTAGVKACNLTNNLCIGKGKGCRITVNEFAETEYKNVYAVGDVSLFQTEQGSLPALVESAIQTGKGAAKNILADLRGKEKENIKPKLHGVMVSIGSYFAVSNLMGKQFPRVLSILAKYLVNIHYLFGIGGFELVIKYIKHEFQHKKQDKTIIEKHVSVRTPTFWLVPIRLFLGFSWLVEGINKIKENWLSEALLTGMQAADGTASASVTGEGFSIITEATPSWYAWIAENLVIPNAMLFQFLIVFAEIGIGLALLSGTFTFLAALASIALNINFLLSTGFNQWWYIAAALCLLGGAGRAFGLDYYLMPYLMRQWRYFVRNKRIKINLFR